MSTFRPEFAGKRALITGGTQGIGKAIAWRLARQGVSVQLNFAHNQAAAEETQAEIRAAGHSVQLWEADLGDEAATAQMIRAVLAAGPLDFVVCNASYQEKKSFFDTDTALLERTLAVNLRANFQVIQASARALIAAGRGGRMVISSSGHGRLVFQDTFAYDVSKAGLNHLMRNAALELIGHDIRLNAVEIGWTHTPGERRWFTEELQTELARGIPIGRAAQPDEIAAILEFLLSDEAAYVVGALYSADGGFALRPNPST